MAEGTIYLKDGNNLAKLILKEGLGRLEGFKEESANNKYQNLMMLLVKAEEEAKEQQLNIHSLKVPNIPTIVYNIEKKNLVIAKEISDKLFGIKKFGKDIGDKPIPHLTGVIEGVVSGNEFVLRLDVQGAMISLALYGISCVSLKHVDVELRKFHEEAKKDAYKTLMTREVKVD